jgi:hypothetical protein
MSNTFQKSVSGPRSRPEPVQKKRFSTTLLIVGIIAGSLCLAGYQIFRNPGGSSPGAISNGENQPEESARSQVPANDDIPVPLSPSQANVVPIHPGPVQVAPRTPVASLPADLPPTSVRSQGLIAEMAQAGMGGGALTQEQGKQINDNLKQLAAEGTAALPAIREFLQKNQDLVFDELNAKKVIGYPSLRAGLLDAVRQIGGPEGIALSRDVLQTTADPSEIALLAQHLEQQAPGQYREEALNAARETLAQIAEGKIAAKEVGPLFQIFQTYGDSSVISDLERTVPQWHYYATMAMAGLPGGEGIPALIHQAQEPAGLSRNTFALQMLAQVSSQYPEAGTALIEQARANQIPDSAWRKIAEGVAGDQYQFVRDVTEGSAALLNLPGLKTYHIESGNQNFYSSPVPANLPPEQIDQRRSLIDQLLAVNSNPAAVQALQSARERLSGGGK